VEIIHTRLFAKSLKKLGASKADLTKLEAEIAANPEAGDVIPGLNGVRKIRFAMGGKGKRGGGRAIYLAVVSAETAYLLLAYAKSQKEDLTEDDKKVLRELATILKT